MKDIELPPLPEPSMFAEYWASDMHAYTLAATAPLLARIADLERQKDEWLSWGAKRRDLEADAGRWREWEQGRGLTVVVPTPTDDKPDRKVTIIYSPNPYPAYPAAVRKAVDAAIKEQP